MVQWDVNILSTVAKRYAVQNVIGVIRLLCSPCLIGHLSWWMMAANDDLMMFSLADSNPIPAERARNTQCHQWHRLCSDQVGMHQLWRVFVAICFFCPTAIFTKTMSTQDLASNRAYSYISRYKVLLGCGWHGCSWFTGCVWEKMWDSNESLPAVCFCVGFVWLQEKAEHFIWVTVLLVFL